MALLHDALNHLKNLLTELARDFDKKKKMKLT